MQDTAAHGGKRGSQHIINVIFSLKFCSHKIMSQHVTVYDGVILLNLAVMVSVYC